MSVRAMAWVWEHATDVQGNDLIVLLALADWADDDGVCWPGFPRLATKARVSLRAVKYIIERLEARGCIRVERGGGRGNVNRYTVQMLHALPSQTMQGLHALEPETVQELHDTGAETVQTLHSSTEETVQVATETVQPLVKAGEIPPTPPYREELITEPPREPSVSARGRASPARNAPLPETFMVTKGMWQWAYDKGMNRDFVKRETEKFVAHFRSTGGTKKNWTMAWHKWLLTAQEGKYQVRRGA